MIKVIAIMNLKTTILRIYSTYFYYMDLFVKHKSESSNKALFSSWKNP